MNFSPRGVTREHVLAALMDLDNGKCHRFGESRKWILIHMGKTYSPKAVLAGAIANKNGSEIWELNTSGGENTNRKLKNLGFEVVAKSNART